MKGMDVIGWFADQVNHYDWGSILLTLFCIAVLYLVVRFYLTDAKPTNTHSHASNTTGSETCNSPDCVRCSKYGQVSAASQLRLQEYMLEHGMDEDLDRVYRSVLDGPKIGTSSNDDQKPNVLFVKGLNSKPVWNTENGEKDHIFQTQTEELGSNYEAILQEYAGVLPLLSEAGGGGWAVNSTPEGTWFTYHIINQGREVTENSVRCPVLAGILKSQHFRDAVMMDCVFGNVFFSQLEPGTRIGEHYGPCNIRLRCHLGMQVPSGWSLAVGREEVTWTERKCVIFDDSFLHSVSHDSTQDTGARVVLIMDLWHPDLTEKEKQLLTAVYGQD